MIRIGAVSIALIAFGSQLQPADAGKLRTVLEVSLGSETNRVEGDPAFPVFALRFSPDGQKLAVIADVYGARQERKSRLLVVDFNRSPTSVGEYEIPFGILDGEQRPDGALNFGWTPSGEIVYAVGTVVHLATGATCELPNYSVFISDNVAVSVQPEPLQSLTHVTIYSQNCEQQVKWEVPETWSVADVSTDRRLLSIVRRAAAPGKVERLIVDPLTRKVLQRRPENSGGDWQFAASGKAVCQGGSVLLGDQAPTICRNADTGEEIARTARNGVKPIATATQSTRIVASDYRRVKIPLDYEYRTRFNGRYIWDFGTGRVLASWMPEEETYRNVFTPAKQVTEPFRFAISPDGRQVAEGGNGIIRLYKVEP